MIPAAAAMMLIDTSTATIWAIRPIFFPTVNSSNGGALNKFIM